METKWCDECQMMTVAGHSHNHDKDRFYYPKWLSNILGVKSGDTHDTGLYRTRKQIHTRIKFLEDFFEDERKYEHLKAVFGENYGECWEHELDWLLEVVAE